MSEVTYTIKEEVFREAIRIAKEGLKIAIKQEDSELVPKNRLEASVRESWQSVNRSIDNCWKSDIKVPSREFSLEEFNWYDDDLKEKVLKTTKILEQIRLHEPDNEFYDDSGRYYESKGHLKEIVSELKSSQYLVEIYYNVLSPSPFYFIKKFRKLLRLASEGFSGEVQVSAEIQRLIDWVLTDSLESLNSIEYYNEEDGHKFIKDLVNRTAKEYYERNCRLTFLENSSKAWDYALTFFLEAERECNLKLEKIENTRLNKLEEANTKDLMKTPSSPMSILSSTVLGALTAIIVMYILYNILIN